MANAKIKRYVDEYGFECLDVRTADGGHKTYSYYGGTTDIGYVSSMNGKGLGSGDYIRHAEDFPRHVASINQTVWLNMVEKLACLGFLNWMQDQAIREKKIVDRFTVKRGYGENKAMWTFTQNEPQLHTTLVFTIETPDQWTVSDAWRVLFKSIG